MKIPVCSVTVYESENVLGVDVFIEGVIVYVATFSPLALEPVMVKVSLEYTDPEVTEYPFNEGSAAPKVLEESEAFIVIGLFVKVMVAMSVAGS